MAKRTEKPKTQMGVVTWYDAHADSPGSWTTLQDIDPDPYLVTTVGVILPDCTKQGHVSVAQSIGQGSIDGIIHIPEKMVSEITILGTLDLEELI